MFTKFKSIEDSNKKSGEKLCTFEFYEDISNIMGDNPNVKPVKTVSVGCVKEVSAVTEKRKGRKGDERNENESVSEAQGRVVTKRGVGQMTVCCHYFRK